MITETELRSLWRELDLYSNDLKSESEKLEAVWQQIASLKLKYNQDLSRLLENNEFTFSEPEMTIIFNVSGHVFESNVEVITKDPYSVLAACCRKNDVILQPDENGMFYFDRDWWLFRHILAFLKSEILPKNLDALKELYMEASFYRLETLQRAIENFPIHELTNDTSELFKSSA